FYGTELWEVMAKNQNYKPSLLAEIKELMKQPGVEQVGAVNQRRMAEEWGKAEYLLFPRNPENCVGEGVLIEAMASGVIIIASDKGNIPEYVGGAGIIIEGDPESEEWQESMLTVLGEIKDDKELKQVMIKRGKERAKEFSWGRVVDKWEGIISEEI
ncbi:unnamed protein product, partial [marine sediment metagenome]